MAKRTEDMPSGEVWGVDGPIRRTRANVLAGYVDSVDETRLIGRNQAWIDEESAWLNAHFVEGDPSAKDEH